MIGITCGEYFINRVGNILRDGRVVGHIPYEYQSDICRWMSNGNMPDSVVIGLIRAVIWEHLED